MTSIYSLCGKCLKGISEFGSVEYKPSVGWQRTSDTSCDVCRDTNALVTTEHEIQKDLADRYWRTFGEPRPKKNWS